MTVPPGPACARVRQGGFTLVELLLSITLMSLLLGLAYGGMRAATRASDGGQAMLEQSSQLRITHQFIRRQLNLMLPLAFEMDDEDDDRGRIVFLGDSDGIWFVGPMPGYLGNGGPQVQMMEVTRGKEGLQLQLRHALLQDFRPEYLDERDPVVLLEGLTDARFEFLEADEDGEVLGWVTAWENTEATPLAVRLDLAFAEEDKVEWPLLIASVRLDALAIGGPQAEDYGQAIQDLIQRRGNRQ